MSRTTLPRPFAVTAVLAPVLVAALSGCNTGDTSDASTSPTKSPRTHAPPHASTPATPGPTSPSTAASPSGTQAYAVYYVGDGPTSPVLYREFHSGPASTSTTRLALQGLGTTPLDPDYTTPWHAGDFSGIQDRTDGSGHGFIRVALNDAALESRPAGMSTATAKAAIQQVVYTVQAALQTMAPVSIELGSRPVDRLLGVHVTQPIARGKVLTTLSAMSISNPNEGAVVTGDSLEVSGANNGFEGTVVLRLMKGSKVLAEQPGIGGMGGNRLYPWTVTLDVSKVPPGTYQLVASNDDASDGEGGRPATDTRTIVIR